MEVLGLPDRTPKPVASSACRRPGVTRSQVTRDRLEKLAISDPQKCCPNDKIKV
ncbi:GM22063 [Drosophila sechellia]|uniref:GM22063 n=1 Tax=Drosophila sechellia TaxID=7238 RepID=B4IQ97_DROSE|nr:GM22063 [Drosophila sechellia]